MKTHAAAQELAKTQVIFIFLLHYLWLLPMWLQDGCYGSTHCILIQDRNRSKGVAWKITVYTEKSARTFSSCLIGQNYITCPPLGDISSNHHYHHLTQWLASSEEPSHCLVANHSLYFHLRDQVLSSCWIIETWHAGHQINLKREAIL